MKNELQKLPTIQEIYTDIDMIKEQDVLMVLLNQPPPDKWIVDHPIIKQEVTISGVKHKVPYRYLPIDKVEYLLRKIFKKHRIEILREGTAFNGVYVVVRVNYQDPITNLMEFHDGIGAIHLQTNAGSSPADLANIKHGALSMAFPLAETLAIKDACDHFGKLFGCDISRSNTLSYDIDPKLNISKPKMVAGTDEYFEAYKLIQEGKRNVQDIEKQYELTPEVENALKNI